MTKESKRVRKHLFSDEELNDGSNAGKKLKNSNLPKVKNFKPKFERPNTRLQNGIQVPKRLNSPDLMTSKRQKMDNTNENGKHNDEKQDVRVVQLRDDASSQKPDSSNNNTSNSGFQDKINPSKFVLTRGVDVAVLGKRKLVDPVPEDIDLLSQDDGIQVMVNEEDELDFDETLEDQELLRAVGVYNGCNSNGERGDLKKNDGGNKTKLMGNNPRSSNRKSKARQKQIPISSQDEPVASTSAMTKEEIKLLEDNPRVQSILNKMVKNTIQQMIPDGNTELNLEVGKGMKNKGQTKQKTNNVLMVKSPSDTTIYAPALTKQNSMHQIIQALNQNPNIDEPFNHEIVHNQVSNFLTS